MFNGKNLVISCFKISSLSLGPEYYVQHSIPQVPGKLWHAGKHDGVGDLDEHCKYVFGKEWRVSL